MTISTIDIDETRPRTTSALTAEVRDNFAEIKTQFGEAATHIATITELRGINSRNGTVLVRGDSAAGDGAGGEYYWNSTSTDSDDGKDVILPTGHTAAGRWIRLYRNAIVKDTKAAVAALGLTQYHAGLKVFITSDDGGEFTVRYNATLATYNDDGGSYCGTQFRPTGGDGTIGIVRDFQGKIYAEWFGAGPSQTGAINTTAFQDAIDYANSLTEGGVVSANPGTYTLASAGTHASRNYGLMLKDNVILDLPGSGICALKADTNADMELIITDRVSGPTTNCGIRGVTVDGNQANQTGANFNYWLYNIDGLYMDDVVSVDPTSWGFRLEDITQFKIGSIEADHAADLNADGVHFLDCSYGVIDKVLINTLGDDGLIIAAESTDCHDISFGEVVVTAPVTTAGAGRGIFFFVDHSVSGAQRSVYNISMPNAITYNCKGSGLTFDAGNFYNINVNHVDYGSANGMNLVVGSATYAGAIRNCDFKTTSWYPDQSGITMSVVSGALSKNKLDHTLYNPGDGYVGVTLQGDYWLPANIHLSYDPLGSKVSQSLGLDVFGSNSEIHLVASGADYNLNLRATADSNTIFPIKLEFAVTSDIAVVAGATDNRFIGGEFSSISDSGTNTRFIGTKGGHNYGNASISPDANGNGTIAHGLAGTPNLATVGIRGDNVNGVDVQAVDGTNITVRVKDAAGADVTAGSFTIDWEARL